MSTRYSAHDDDVELAREPPSTSPVDASSASTAVRAAHRDAPHKSAVERPPDPEALKGKIELHRKRNDSLGGEGATRRPLQLDALDRLLSPSASSSSAGSHSAVNNNDSNSEDSSSDGGCAEAEAQSASTRPHLSGLPTSSTPSSCTAAAATHAAGGGYINTTSSSSNTAHVVATLQNVPPPPPPPPPPLQQQPSPSSISHEVPSEAVPDDDAHDAVAATVPVPPPRAVSRGSPAVLASISSYKSVPVLPPQVFRSASSTTTPMSPGAGAAIIGGGGNHSTVSTPVLSPPQQTWFSTTSPAAATAGGALSSIQLSSPPMRTTPVLQSPRSAEVTTPVNSITAGAASSSAAGGRAAASNTLAASSPSRLPVRAAFSLGGSRKRNSVSVPAGVDLCSEDDDNVNFYVADEGYQSTDHWLMLSQSMSNVGNITVMSPAVTSRSSSHDHGPTEESGNTTATTMMTTRGINSSQTNYNSCSSTVNNYQPPSTWSLVTPQALPEPPRMARNATIAPGTAHTFSGGSGSVADPPPATAVVTGQAESAASTPRNGNGCRSTSRSHDPSLALSLHSPLQSPPTAAVPGPAGRGGGGATSLLSRRGSMGSLRLATHDPYSAAVMSPAVVPRTGSQSSLRSPSATLTSPTASAVATTTASARGNVSRGGQNAAVLSHFGDHRSSNDDCSSIGGPPNLPDAFLCSHPNPSFAGSNSGAATAAPAQPVTELPLSLPLYLQHFQQQQQQHESAAPHLVSPLSRSGQQPDLTSSFLHTPQTSTSLAMPTQRFGPPPPQLPSHQLPQQQQQQLPASSLFPAAAARPPLQPRRRTAQEVLKGFYSEVPIELGDQTHLALDRNGVPYPNAPTAVTTAHAMQGTSLSTNANFCGNNNSNCCSNSNVNGALSLSMLPSTAPLPCVCAGGPPAQQQTFYYRSTDSMMSGPAPQDPYDPYLPPSHPLPPQPQYPLVTATNPVPSTLYHQPVAQGGSVMEAPSYHDGGDYRPLRSTSHGAVPLESAPLQLPDHRSVSSSQRGGGGENGGYACAAKGGDFYGSAVFCTEMGSQACAAAFGSANGVSMSQLYPMDSAMYPTTTATVMNANVSAAPVAGTGPRHHQSSSGSGSNSSPPFSLANNSSTAASAGQVEEVYATNNYAALNITKSPAMFGEADGRRRVGGDAFIAPLPRSVAAAGGGMPMSLGEKDSSRHSSVPQRQRVTEGTMNVADALQQHHHLKPSVGFPPTMQQHAQQHQQQMMMTAASPSLAQSYPSAANANWSEGNGGSARDAQLPGATSSILSTYALPTPSTSMGPSLAGWIDAGLCRGGAEEHRVLPQACNVERGGNHSIVGGAPQRGGVRRSSA
jgi:hypothetical protein